MPPATWPRSGAETSTTPARPSTSPRTQARGTLGVAVIGSVFSSVYAGALADGTVLEQLPVETRTLTAESVGTAKIVAEDLGPTAPAYLTEVSDRSCPAFGMASLLVGAGSLFAAKFLPARAAQADDVDDIDPAVPATHSPDDGAGVGTHDLETTPVS